MAVTPVSAAAESTQKGANRQHPAIGALCGRYGLLPMEFYRCIAGRSKKSLGGAANLSKTLKLRFKKYNTLEPQRAAIRRLIVD